VGKNGGPVKKGKKKKKLREKYEGHKRPWGKESKLYEEKKKKKKNLLEGGPLVRG